MSTPRSAIVLALMPLSGLPSPGRPLTPELIACWAVALADLPLDRIQCAVAHALRCERYYPVPAVLRAYAEPPRDLAAEAARVYTAIGALERYDPHRGGYWIEAEIRTHLGDAAAEAFIAAGGSRARLREDDTWTRKAFAESYTLVARTVSPPEIPSSVTLRAIAHAPRQIESSRAEDVDWWSTTARRLALPPARDTQEHVS